MKIEVGKSYINAEGDVVKILKLWNTVTYPYTCREYSYTIQGRRVIGQESPQDLICEVVPEIYEAYILGYVLSQRDLISKHIKYWAKNEWANIKRIFSTN